MRTQVEQCRSQFEQAERAEADDQSLFAPHQISASGRILIAWPRAGADSGNEQNRQARDFRKAVSLGRRGQIFNPGGRLHMRDFSQTERRGDHSRRDHAFRRLREAAIARVIPNLIDQFAQRVAQTGGRSVARGITDADASLRPRGDLVTDSQPDPGIGRARVNADQANLFGGAARHFAPPHAASTNSEARRRNDSKPLSFITSLPINSDPTPSAHAPAAM